jgi:hypothetical protein
MEMLDAVSDSLAVARRNKGDVDVILFVKLQEGHVLDDAAVTLIKVSFCYSIGFVTLLAGVSTNMSSLTPLSCTYRVRGVD